MTRLFLRLAPALLLLAAAPPTPVARPALWKLADADTTIWLFGTVHVLPANYRWRGPMIDRAIAGSQSLTLETILDEEPGRVATALMTLGRAKGLPPLAERVPAGRREALAALVKQSGVPMEVLDGMKTWAAAVLLTGPALSRIALAGGWGQGVEPQLTATFRQSVRPVLGLETPEQQLGYFDALPEASQRTFLAETVEPAADAGDDFQRMLRAWSKGDVAAIERAFAEDPEFTPALRDLLVVRRDRLWADALAARLEKPGTVFVAVGAGHLAGPDSVQRMLAAKGFRVTRVQ